MIISKRTGTHGRLLFLGLIIALLTLAACQGVDQGAELASAVAATATSPAATFTATFTATAVPPTVTATGTPTPTYTPTATATATNTATPTATPTPNHPLMIEVIRRGEYPGSELVIERTLEPGVNYGKYVASYESEGNKIYALLTIPWGNKPESGWPVIIFNHGWIEPEEYSTTTRYLDYVDYLARSGYIVFRSDYRGHGNSEGVAGAIYSSPNYTVDVLNGMASVQNHPDADPDRVGMWGHSMGGNITLRSMVVSDEIKAGVIWGGVVGAYPDLFAFGYLAEQARLNPQETGTPLPPHWRNWMTRAYGSRRSNPDFYRSVSPNSFLHDLSGPLQLHHATTDDVVPSAASQLLHQQMKSYDQYSELYLYEGDNHNIAVNFYTAMGRSLEFFDEYVKGG